MAREAASAPPAGPTVTRVVCCWRLGGRLRLIGLVVDVDVDRDGAGADCRKRSSDPGRRATSKCGLTWLLRAWGAARGPQLPSCLGKRRAAALTLPGGWEDSGQVAVQEQNGEESQEALGGSRCKAWPAAGTGPHSLLAPGASYKREAECIRVAQVLR